MAQLPREKFNETLQQFASSLTKAFPEEADMIQAAFEKRVSIHAFVKKIQPYADSIRNQDSTLFDTKFDIFDGLDLSRLWAKNMTDSARSAMWQYLQLLLLLGTLVTSTEDIMESKQMQEIIDKMKSASHASTAADSNSTEADKQDESQDDSEKPSVLEKLAHEIAADLPIPDGLVDSLQNCENSMQLLGTLFKHQDCLPGIGQTICEKVQGKFESGDLSEQTIMAEIQPLLSKLSGVLGKDLDADTLSAMFQGAEPGENPLGNIFSMAQSMLGGLSAGQSGGVDLPGLFIKNFMAVAGNGMLGGMMNSSNNEEDLPDLADLEKKVRSEMRNSYRSQQAQNALPSRSSAKRAQLKEKLEARRKAKELPAPK